jgi:hypothetical protein
MEDEDAITTEELLEKLTSEKIKEHDETLLEHIEAFLPGDQFYLFDKTLPQKFKAYAKKFLTLYTTDMGQKSAQDNVEMFIKKGDVRLFPELEEIYNDLFSMRNMEVGRHMDRLSKVDVTSPELSPLYLNGTYLIHEKRERPYTMVDSLKIQSREYCSIYEDLLLRLLDIYRRENKEEITSFKRIVCRNLIFSVLTKILFLDHDNFFYYCIMRDYLYGIGTALFKRYTTRLVKYSRSELRLPKWDSNSCYSDSLFIALYAASGYFGYALMKASRNESLLSTYRIDDSNIPSLIKPTFFEIFGYQLLFSRTVMRNLDVFLDKNDVEANTEALQNPFIRNADGILPETRNYMATLFFNSIRDNKRIAIFKDRMDYYGQEVFKAEKTKGPEKYPVEDLCNMRNEFGSFGSGRFENATEFYSYFMNALELQGNFTVLFKVQEFVSFESSDGKIFVGTIPNSDKITRLTNDDTLIKRREEHMELDRLDVAMKKELEPKFRDTYFENSCETETAFTSALGDITGKGDLSQQDLFLVLEEIKANNWEYPIKITKSMFSFPCHLPYQLVITNGYSPDASGSTVSTPFTYERELFNKYQTALFMLKDIQGMYHVYALKSFIILHHYHYTTYFLHTIDLNERRRHLGIDPKKVNKLGDEMRTSWYYYDDNTSQTLTEVDTNTAYNDFITESEILVFVKTYYGDKPVTILQ